MILLCMFIFFMPIYSIKEMKFGNATPYYTKFIYPESLVKESGNNWLTIENVVVQMNYTYGKSIFFLNLKDRQEFNKIYNNIFPHCFYSVYFALPVMLQYYYVWPNDEGIWYYSSYCGTLFHRWDTFMLYVIDNDKDYPPINEVIFDGYDRREDRYEMQNYYNKMLEKKLSNTEFYYKEEMSKLYRKYYFIFFKRIHILFRSGYNGFFFIDRNKAYEFRDFGMNLGGIKRDDLYLMKNKNIINICIIQRKNGNNTRNIINLKEIYSLLKDYKNKKKEKINIEVISFDDINSVEQIKIIMNRDIIISSHGSGLVNMLWILNKKVTIIEVYSIFRTDAYLKLTSVFGFHSFPLSSVKVYDDLNVYYDFKNEKNSSYYYDNYPQIHHNIFSHHPIRDARNSQVKLGLKQVLYGIYYSLNYLY